MCLIAVIDRNFKYSDSYSIDIHLSPNYLDLGALFSNTNIGDDCLCDSTVTEIPVDLSSDTYSSSVISSTEI